MMEEQRKTFFQRQLMDWFAGHSRPMPWKGEKNPYLIWLSEIILQQTRVEQGRPYFEKFKRLFPTVHALADASEDQVMKAWEGLGYYSRARNLHATAKYISKDLAGQFPTNYSDILALKGVGPYTAAAISSFAYDLPYAVVDGNVYRILARFEGIEKAIDSSIGKKEFANLAQDLLIDERAADFNQAMMDFGASQCVPKSPNCKACPLNDACIAYRDNLVGLLPYKAKKLKRRQRNFHYFLFNHDGYTWINKRSEKDIWQNLYDFPLIETDDSTLDLRALKQLDSWTKWLGQNSYDVISISPPRKQDLTHQRIIGVFWELELDRALSPDLGFIQVDRKKLHEYAFPKLIDWYLRDNSLFLNLFPAS